MVKLEMIEKPLFWMGCVYRNNAREHLTEITNLLTKHDVKFNTFEKEECCGYPLIISGHMKEAKEFANRNIELIGFTIQCHPVMDFTISLFLSFGESLCS